MLEIEAKLRIEDVEALRRRLDDLGARLEPPREQTDLFFDHPQRRFAETDESLRLRFEDGLLELTYKGPKEEAGGAKARLEHNVPVGVDPTPVLERLGFRGVAVLQKTRASTRLEGCLIELDHVEGLGWFLEVECLAEDPRLAAALIHKTLVRLGLQDAPRISESYLELALQGGAAGVRTLD